MTTRGSPSVGPVLGTHRLWIDLLIFTALPPPPQEVVEMPLPFERWGIQAQNSGAAQLGRGSLTPELLLLTTVKVGILVLEHVS